MIYNYYIKFLQGKKINFFNLLALMEVAEFRTITQAFDYIKYTSIYNLSQQTGIAEKTLTRMLSSAEYTEYFTVNKKEKTIIFDNDFRNSKTPFVKLTRDEIQTLRKYDDNFLIRYYIYIKYYCGMAKYNNTQQDFTAKQFLLSQGMSDKSNNNISKISKFNNILTEEKLIKIVKYRDGRGHTRNTYSIS